MADITVTALKTKPLPGAIIREAYIDTGQTIAPGQAVYISGENNGLPEISLADADAAASARVWGIVVSVGTFGDVSAGAGEIASVVIFGPVAGFSSMTAGGLVYASTTAGALEDSAPAGSSGDYLWIVGQSMSAEVVLVSPFTPDLAAQ